MRVERWVLGAVLATAVVTACSSVPSASPSGDGERATPRGGALAYFDGTVDTARGVMSLVVRSPSGEITSQSTLPYGNAPGAVYFHTCSARYDAGAHQLSGAVQAVNLMSAAIGSMDAVIDSVSVTGITLASGPGAGAPSGIVARYGRVAVNSADCASSQPWVFQNVPGDPDFRFRGHADGSCLEGATEQCGNGVDDDCNGWTDCEDPACSAYVCADAAPAGWLGPLTVQTQSPGDPSVACAAPYAKPVFTGYAGLDPSENLCASAVCPSCGPMTFQCSASVSQAQAYDSTSGYGGACRGQWTCAVLSNPPMDQCINLAIDHCGGLGPYPRIPYTTADWFVWTSDGVVSNAGCAGPQGGTASPTPATWASRAQACSSDGVGGGCGAASACVPRPPGGAKLCIAREGDLACPAGPFSERAVDDVVSCPCHCSAPPWATQCTVAARLYTEANCGGYPANVPSNNTCAVMQNPTHSIRFDAALSAYPWGPLSCDAVADPPQAGVSPAQAWTVCCQP